MEGDDPLWFTEHITRQLERTHPSGWPRLALLIQVGDSAQLMDRVSLVTWLRANDLPKLANEVLHRSVPDGCLLSLAVDEDGPKIYVIGDPRNRVVAPAAVVVTPPPSEPIAEEPVEFEPDFDALRPRIPGRPMMGRKSTP